MRVTGKITKHFYLEEMACKDREKTLVLTPEAIVHAQRLQYFREWYNRPMVVNSWYRTKDHNKAVGGAANSCHLYGIATDIALPQAFYGYDKARKNQFIDHCRVKWHALCSGSGGFGIYDTFMHFDSRVAYTDFDYRK